jgi:O-antigen ligase
VLIAERVAVALLLAYAIWLPMPFGSVVDGAFLPLVLPPIVLCGVAAAMRLRQFPQAPAPAAWRIWTIGGAAFIVLVALQLIPMPRPLLALISPGSHAIWSSAERIVMTSHAEPVSIDPMLTRRELVRLIALFAAMQAAAMLITTNTRRLLFAATLSLTAIFETLYGVHEAALRRYAIWGWVNKLIFNRVTGTFVNPNHFAHYIALTLPFTFFIAALAWRQTGATTMPLRRRIVLLFEKALPMFGAALILFVGCVAGILLAQSRGALAATFAGLATTGLIAARRERHPEIEQGRARRARAAHSPATVVFLSIVTLSALTILLVVFLGRDRTVARFEPNAAQRATLVGRTTGIGAALSLWRRFPLFGSGFGTFGDVVSIVQKDDLEHIYQHAHDDYAEILATTGVAGFAIAVATFLGGAWMITREVLRRPRESGSWRRRAFEMAALWSLAVALAHALIDFNFFIPANAATLALIAGACVARRVKETREEPERGAVPGFA